MEDDEDGKNKESVQGKGHRKLQVGDKMEEDGEENEGQISELASGVSELAAAPDLASGTGEIFPKEIN